MNNEKAAAHGRLAVLAGTPDWEYNDAQTNLVDALANLMHYAQVTGLDFDEALDWAQEHFTAEVQEQAA